MRLRTGVTRVNTHKKALRCLRSAVSLAIQGFRDYFRGLKACFKGEYRLNRPFEE